ncbi:hypothetical protein BJ165DRAFT_1414033 [Panaeolus papilionaceus]|nr:hypothetical protein BJ165DRAFT_1414033 [Panaeolus papilionaceus]
MTLTDNNPTISFQPTAVPLPQGIPTKGPLDHPEGPPPQESTYNNPQTTSSNNTNNSTNNSNSNSTIMHSPPSRNSPLGDIYFNHHHHHNTFQQNLPSSSKSLPQSAQSLEQSTILQPQTPSAGPGANHYPSSSGVPRLPPILQVEKQQVTTSATQIASASRRRNEAHFVCPVPGCGSHLRSHTEERPYVCEWPGCKKGFARQHDCKRHQALHAAKSQSNICQGCKKTFSRLDALNVLRSDGGAECRASNPKFAAMEEQQQQQAAAIAAAQAQALQQQSLPAPPPPPPAASVQAPPPGPMTGIQTLNAQQAAAAVAAVTVQAFAAQAQVQQVGQVAQ